MRLAGVGAFVLVLVLAGCSTDRTYKITHDEMIDAAILAMCDDGNCLASEVTRTEITEKGGRLTTLIAPYKRESRAECKIDTREKYHDVPNLEIRIITKDGLYTRHKDWEWRLHEIVEHKLKASGHGSESKPSSMPQVKPQLPPEVDPKKPDVKPDVKPQ